MLTADWVFEESPCELCPHVARCRCGLACAAFESFLQHGGRRWRTEPREPSADIYRRIFWESAEHESSKTALHAV